MSCEFSRVLVPRLAMLFAKWRVLRALRLRLASVLPPRTDAPGTAALNRPHGLPMGFSGVRAASQRSWQLGREAGTRQQQARRACDTASRSLLVGLGTRRPKVSKLPSECRASCLSSRVLSSSRSSLQLAGALSADEHGVGACGRAEPGRGGSNRVGRARRVSMCTPEASSCSTFHV